jgi:hypothetical protein
VICRGSNPLGVRITATPGSSTGACPAWLVLAPIGEDTFASRLTADSRFLASEFLTHEALLNRAHVLLNNPHPSLPLIDLRRTSSAAVNASSTTSALLVTVTTPVYDFW